MSVRPNSQRQGSACDDGNRQAMPANAPLASRLLHDLCDASHRSVHLSVIIPTYNEKENIELLLCLLHNHLRNVTEANGDTQGSTNVGKPAGLKRGADAAWWWEVIVVDDNSPDGTAQVVQQLQQDELLGCNLQLVQRPGKLGLGTAYAAGLCKARGDWIVLMDADLSHHPKYLIPMLRKQAETGCDVVSGTRYRAGGGVTGWNWKRKLTSRGANLLASVLLGATQSDLTGAYRMYRRTCLQQVLQKTTCRGYAFQMEVAVRCQHEHYDVQEVPIVFVDRLYGTSKLGREEFIGFLKGLKQLFFML